MGRVDWHFVSRALRDGPAECGDAGIVEMRGNRCFLGLVDALGHGKDACEIARLAIDHLKENPSDDLAAAMRGLHERLKGTKGIVAALCLLDVGTGELVHVGMGNICVKILGPRRFTFVPRDGVMGYIMPTPREQRRRLYPGDTLVMHSDGIREHFDPLDCAGLLQESAESIAHGLLGQFGKKDDDASCIALKYLI